MVSNISQWSTIRCTACSWVSVVRLTDLMADHGVAHQLLGEVEIALVPDDEVVQLHHLASGPGHANTSSASISSMVGHRAIGQRQAERARPLRQRVPAVERDHRQHHQVGDGESVVPPRLLEGVVADAALGQPFEVLAHQRLVVATTHRCRQSLADQVADISGAYTARRELEVHHLDVVTVEEQVVCPDVAVQEHRPLGQRGQSVSGMVGEPLGECGDCGRNRRR